MPESFFPDVIGHESILRLLSSSVGHPAPAYVFAGRGHLGKRMVAERFCAALLQLAAVTELYAHPDFLILEPEEGKKQVSVERVREVRERVFLRPMTASRVVVLIPFADRMNESGTNALLKVLEEPPADAVFVLIAEDLGRIPATVLSRSVTLSFLPVAEAVIRDALVARGVDATDASTRAHAAHGCPGLAIVPTTDAGIGEEFVAAMMRASSVGARLQMIEELTKACDGAEDPSAMWRDVLIEAMRSMRDGFASSSAEAVVFGVALAQAMRMVGGAVSPRVALDAGAVRMSDGHADAQAALLQSTHTPRATPLFFEKL